MLKVEAIQSEKNSRNSWQKTEKMGGGEYLHIFIFSFQMSTQTQKKKASILKMQRERES